MIEAPVVRCAVRCADRGKLAKGKLIRDLARGRRGRLAGISRIRSGNATPLGFSGTLATDRWFSQGATSGPHPHGVDRTVARLSASVDRAPGLGFRTVSRSRMPQDTGRTDGVACPPRPIRRYTRGAARGWRLRDRPLSEHARRGSSALMLMVLIATPKIFGARERKASGPGYDLRELHRVVFVD